MFCKCAYSGRLHAHLQEALARGALSGADVLLWLRIRAVPVVGWVCEHWPAFRHAFASHIQHLRDEQHVGMVQRIRFNAAVKQHRPGPLASLLRMPQGLRVLARQEVLQALLIVLPHAHHHHICMASAG